MSGGDPTEVFRQEAAELLETLENNLLDLDSRPDDRELVDSAFRALHTLKGSGAMFGFVAAAEFLHDFETAFDKVRNGEAPVSPELVQLALRAKDHVASLVTDPSIQHHGGDDIIAALRTLLGEPGAAPATADAASAPTGSGGNGDAAAAPQIDGWLIEFALPSDVLTIGASPQLLIDELCGLGACRVQASLADLPALEVFNPEICHLKWRVTLTGACTLEAVEDVFVFVREDMTLSITPIGGPAAGEGADQSAAAGGPDAASAEADGAAAPAAKADGGAEKGAEKTVERASSLRVPAERLDDLMDRVGELVIAQARLHQLAAQNNDPNLSNVSEEIERLSANLRDTTMGIRMVPIGSLFGRFRRLVHDLSSDLGKDIDFVTVGEATELDKTMIELLADPMVHLIRNSVDHGLESGDDREAAGKPRTGTVKISAEYAGAEVAITISDDGAGLNKDRIRARAEQNGVITPNQELTDNELYNLIFAPGFSTAKEVTSLSGRGVGMDVVKRSIESLRGGIELHSTPGEGSSVVMRLPLTLAIVEGLLVRVGSNCYSIPLAAVEECVELGNGDEDGSKSRSFLNIRGELVPFLSLRELFDADGEPDVHQKVVIVSSGETRVGLVVDQILGNNQTVIKQLSKLHADVTTFSGATILGDGTVALILDVMNLVTYGRNMETEIRNQPFGRAA